MYMLTIAYYLLPSCVQAPLPQRLQLQPLLLSPSDRRRKAKTTESGDRCDHDGQAKKRVERENMQATGHIYIHIYIYIYILLRIVL